MIDEISDMTIISDSQEDISADTLITFYNGKPIFKEFLEKVELPDENTMKKTKQVKWAKMNEKEKKYYLYNKIQYYKCIKSKKKSEIKENEKINNEVQNRISELQEKIKKKEDEIKTNNNKASKINQFSKQIVSYSSQINDLIEKIQKAEGIIENFENSSNTEPIGKIVNELQLEKQKLTSKIEANEDEIKQYEKEINKITEKINKYEIANLKDL